MIQKSTTSKRQETSAFSKQAYGLPPRVKISHMVTPKLHTSEANDDILRESMSKQNGLNRSNAGDADYFFSIPEVEGLGSHPTERQGPNSRGSVVLLLKSKKKNKRN